MLQSLAHNWWADVQLLNGWRKSDKLKTANDAEWILGNVNKRYFATAEPSKQGKRCSFF